MNQEKIGKFILECRKERKITQSELAEKLGVTDKSVSNWENGRNLPDASLYEPLCDVLGISINELISGRKLNENEYQKKLEENIMLLNENTKKNINKIKRILLMLILSIFMIAILIGILLYVKDKYDYQLTELSIDEVNYEVCEYRPNANEKQIIIKSIANDGKGSMLRVMHEYDDDGILVVHNTRYKKWIRNPQALDEIGTNKITPLEYPKKIYYKDTLIWDNTKNLPECIESKGITRTYKVVAVNESEEENYYYVTIKKFQDDSLYNALIEKKLVDSLEIEKNYEFTFNYSLMTHLKNDETETLFETLELLSIKETDKVGLSQIQDVIR